MLQFGDRTLPISRSELQALAANESTSPELLQFLQESEQTPENISRWLTTAITPPKSLRNSTRDFALIQLNKAVGNPLRDGSLHALQASLSKSLQKDDRFTLMELTENYPASTVRLDLGLLASVYDDVDRVMTRLEPVLQVTQSLIPELVCDCSAASADQEPATPQSRAVFKTLQPALGTIAEPSGKAILTAQLPSDSPALVNRNLVIQFGLLGRSIPLQDLTRFAETGELSRGWRSIFRVAGIDPDAVQNGLNQPIAANLRFLDRTLNTLLGEYLLFQVGQVVRTRANVANIQALRSAIVLSAAEDGQLSLLEILQRYPTPDAVIDARVLARLGRQVSRFQPRAAAQSAGMALEDWLLSLQASAADTRCVCEDGKPISSTSSVVPPVPPTISADRIAQFLPSNWQPVSPRRVDRGIIRVIWLQGTPYEMGYQHGQMLHEEIASLGNEVLGVLRLAGRGLALGQFAANRSYPDVIEECRGLTAATQDIGMTFESCMALAYGDVLQEIFGNTLPNVLFWDGCSQWVATGEATVDGRLYHGSTLDNQDRPVDYIMNNPVVFVRQPQNGLPHVFITYPAVVWPNWGLNVAGITMGLDSLHPRSFAEMNLDGRSDVQMMAQVLRTSTTFTEARQLKESEPSARANLIMIADGKSKEADVFEIVGNHLAVRELQENGVLYVTNHAEQPEIFEHQRLPLNASTTSRFKRFAQLMEPDGVSTLYGKLDAAGMVKIGRDRTDPNTMQPSPLELFDDDASPGGNGSLRQGVYDPDKLLLWVAAGSPPVPENPFVCFSLGEMLNFPNAVPCESPSL